MTVTVDYLGADLDIKKPNCPRWKKSEMGLFTALFGTIHSNKDKN
jgi:hypothetical protein